MASNNNAVAYCSICYENYFPADRIAAGNCGHVFHRDCLQRCVDELSKCPVCRRNTHELFAIHLDFRDTNASPAAAPSTASASTSESSNSSSGDFNANAIREFENLLYESGLYQEEIGYLNAHIAELEAQLEQLNV